MKKPPPDPDVAIAAPTDSVLTVYDDEHTGFLISNHEVAVRNYLTGTAYALVTAFVGILLPMTSEMGPIRRPTNLLLGFAYGLGWFVGGTVGDMRSMVVERFGWLVWPLIVMGLIGYFLGRLLSDYPDWGMVIAAGCIILLLLIVSGDLVATTFLKYIPTYSSILLSIY